MRFVDIGWNCLGLGAPLVVAALTVPPLIHRIGMERFGLLALAFGLVGFGGMFDLGVGRAATQAIAKLRGGGRWDQIPPVLETAYRLSFRTGTAGAVLMVALIAAGVLAHIKCSPALRAEATKAAYLVALALPLQSMGAVFRGVNEAFESFRDINLVRVGLGVANFLGPFCVALFTVNLAPLASTLLLSRCASFLLYRKLAGDCLARNLPVSARNASARISPAVAKQLLSFGGWFTASNLIGPVYAQADRFFIAALLSAAAVAAYTIPYEVVTRGLIIAGAVSGVAFPSLSKMAHSRPEEARAALRKWLFRISAVMLVVLSLCIILLPAVLPWWIGPALPAGSVLVGQVLCAGVFANSLGSMYFALLHAYGRADITAKAHLIELPLFLLALYFLVIHLGVLGAALAWVGRMLLDAALLWAAHRFYCTSENRPGAVELPPESALNPLQGLKNLPDPRTYGLP